MSDLELKIARLGLLLVEKWSDKSLILRFLGLIFCLATLLFQFTIWSSPILYLGRCHEEFREVRGL